MMIQLTINESKNIILTLTEKETISTPNYLFRFLNRSTNVDVKFVLVNAKDLSLFKDRFNKFLIVTDNYFSKVGQYTYYVYQQTSATNTDIDNKVLLESGIMMLSEPKTIYKEYKTSDKFKIIK